MQLINNEDKINKSCKILYNILNLSLIKIEERSKRHNGRSLI